MNTDIAGNITITPILKPAPVPGTAARAAKARSQRNGALLLVILCFVAAFVVNGFAKGAVLDPKWENILSSVAIVCLVAGSAASSSRK